MRLASRELIVRGLTALAVSNIFPSAGMASSTEFKKLPSIQFIAANVDPTGGGIQASRGSGAESWGIWRVDPGPRGVRLNSYRTLEANGGKASAGWTFNKNDWWLEEHGLIMEAPDFPLPAGKYMVTGGRQTTTVLTIAPDGSWELAGGAKLYDVTHLPCRSARYTPNGDGSPATANPRDFPVTPGGPMPAVPGTNKQDYVRARFPVCHELPSSLFMVDGRLRDTRSSLACAQAVIFVTALGA